MKHANMVRAVLASHYGQPVTHKQAVDEIRNLKRKQASGLLDDKAEHLVARLETATGEELADFLGA